MKSSFPNVVLITQGQFAVRSEPDAIISTLLGSCVAACLWDPVSGVGGMNHILLPPAAKSLHRHRLAANDMELLVNGVMNAGADRSRLRAKIFGGARVTQKLGNIGAMNVKFVQSYLMNEGIPCLAKDIGGTMARNLKFWPFSGAAKVRRSLGDGLAELATERTCRDPDATEGRVELF